jgi:LPXTG-site transpeptidase (sortase) family protein
MFIFGHSSNWPVVHNQAYKTFNGIGTLENGDEIFVYTIDKVYKYVVSSVKLVDSSQAYVSFDASDTMLTLSTCNSFGTKEERFVVEAKLVSTLSS